MRGDEADTGHRRPRVFRMTLGRLIFDQRRRRAAGLARREMRFAEIGEPLQRVTRPTLIAMAVGPFVVAGRVKQRRGETVHLLQHTVDQLAVSRTAYRVADINDQRGIGRVRGVDQGGAGSSSQQEAIRKKARSAKETPRMIARHARYPRSVFRRRRAPAHSAGVGAASLGRAACSPVTPSVKRRSGGTRSSVSTAESDSPPSTTEPSPR